MVYRTSKKELIDKNLINYIYEENEELRERIEDESASSFAKWLIGSSLILILLFIIIFSKISVIKEDISAKTRDGGREFRILENRIESLEHVFDRNNIDY